MFNTLSRWGVTGLLTGLLLVGTGIAQPPEVPPYDPDAPLGDSPPIPGSQQINPNNPPPTNQGEVQARGPVHEAFAQPGESSVKGGIIVPKAPPEAVQEVPPDQKPDGANVVWIPGYWSWDEERTDFTWVSGFWRVAPAGRKWVPGYWNKAEAGYQWVSGFWANANATEVPYVDVPPASLDRGPAVPAPDDNSVYVPGCWMFRETRFLWRPGHWIPERVGYVYCAPRYSWTPNGCVFVGGYWDTCLENRGVLFAPVCFPRALYNRPGWSFRPSYVIDASALLGSLWVRPNVGSYAFGDYYAAGYARRGFAPWIGFAGRYRDPLYNYYRGINRRNPGWGAGLLATYRGRLSGTVALPPRTLVAQNRLFAGSRTVSSGLRMVQPLRGFRSGSLRMTRVTATHRAAQARLVAGFRRAGVERARVESRGVRSGGAGFLHHVPGLPGVRSGRTGFSASGAVRPGGAIRSARPAAVARNNIGRRVGGTGAFRATSRAGTSARTGGFSAHRAETVHRSGNVTRRSAARNLPAKPHTTHRSVEGRRSGNRTASPHRSASPAKRSGPGKDGRRHK